MSLSLLVRPFWRRHDDCEPVFRNLKPIVYWSIPFLQWQFWSEPDARYIELLRTISATFVSFDKSVLFKLPSQTEFSCSHGKTRRNCPLFPQPNQSPVLTCDWQRSVKSVTVRPWDLKNTVETAHSSVTSRTFPYTKGSNFFPPALLRVLLSAILFLGEH